LSRAQVSARRERFGGSIPPLHFVVICTSFEEEPSGSFRILDSTRVSYWGRERGNIHDSDGLGNPLRPTVAFASASEHGEGGAHRVPALDGLSRRGHVDTRNRRDRL